MLCPSSRYYLGNYDIKQVFSANADYLGNSEYSPCSAPFAEQTNPVYRS